MMPLYIRNVCGMYAYPFHFRRGLEAFVSARRGIAMPSIWQLHPDLAPLFSLPAFGAFEVCTYDPRSFNNHYSLTRIANRVNHVRVMRQIVEGAYAQGWLLPQFQEMEIPEVIAHLDNLNPYRHNRISFHIFPAILNTWTERQFAAGIEHWCNTRLMTTHLCLNGVPDGGMPNSCTSLSHVILSSNFVNIVDECALEACRAMRQDDGTDNVYGTLLALIGCSECTSHIAGQHRVVGMPGVDYRQAVRELLLQQQQQQEADEQEADEQEN